MAKLLDKKIYPPEMKKYRCSLILLLFVLLPAVSLGCGRVSRAQQEREYWSRVKALRKLPAVELKDKDVVRRNLRILQEKVDVAENTKAPAGLSSYHYQLKKVLRLYYQVYRLAYMGGSLYGTRNRRLTLSLLDARIEEGVLNDWPVPTGAAKLSGEEYFALITRVFIDEQQPAHQEFNAYLSGDDVTDAGIKQRLQADKEMLRREERRLVKTKPPAKLASLRRRFIKVVLMDEQADDLYVRALTADKGAVETLTSLSNHYAAAADAELAAALKDLATATKQQIRWRVE